MLRHPVIYVDDERNKLRVNGVCTIKKSFLSPCRVAWQILDKTVQSSSLMVEKKSVGANREQVFVASQKLLTLFFGCTQITEFTTQPQICISNVKGRGMRSYEGRNGRKNLPNCSNSREKRLQNGRMNRLQRLWNHATTIIQCNQNDIKPANLLEEQNTYVLQAGKTSRF